MVNKKQFGKFQSGIVVFGIIVIALVIALSMFGSASGAFHLIQQPSTPPPEPSITIPEPTSILFPSPSFAGVPIADAPALINPLLATDPEPLNAEPATAFVPEANPPVTIPICFRVLFCRSFNASFLIISSVEETKPFVFSSLSMCSTSFFLSNIKSMFFLSKSVNSFLVRFESFLPARFSSNIFWSLADNKFLLNSAFSTLCALLGNLCPPFLNLTPVVSALGSLDFLVTFL